jgi:hypothetical protein
VIGLSVNTLKVQLILPSKPNFYNFFEFSATKSIQKYIFSTFSSKNSEISFIEFDLCQ